MTRSDQRIEGILLDERIALTLAEMTRLCGMSGRTVHLMVTEGVLRPKGEGPQDWRFSALEIRRARRAARLRRDLEVNLAGAALALDLLDELDRLRARVRVLEHRLGSDADSIADSIRLD